MSSVPTPGGVSASTSLEISHASDTNEQQPSLSSSGSKFLDSLLRSVNDPCGHLQAVVYRYPGEAKEWHHAVVQPYKEEILHLNRADLTDFLNSSDIYHNSSQGCYWRAGFEKEDYGYLLSRDDVLPKTRKEVRTIATTLGLDSAQSGGSRTSARTVGSIQSVGELWDRLDGLSQQGSGGPSAAMTTQPVEESADQGMESEPAGTSGLAETSSTEQPPSLSDAGVRLVRALRKTANAAARFASATNAEDELEIPMIGPLVSLERNRDFTYLTMVPTFPEFVYVNSTELPDFVRKHRTLTFRFPLQFDKSNTDDGGKINFVLSETDLAPATITQLDDLETRLNSAGSAASIASSTGF
ncbi:hypothetical protein BCR39DRAFT_558934 [Naematelia encephala]|uniref:Uncharacterized protein n=1 Tax=Naematelia encephala TaxID=71784 RepID=A0A1Y2B529_9TREE|nr:hypothetical protein BCR39DRAFT_558934 [Naematelia encephala]